MPDELVYREASAEGTLAIEGALAALPSPAAEYFTKPLGRNRNWVSLARPARLPRHQENLGCRPEAKRAVPSVGTPPAMTQVWALVRRAAASDATVLIVGESGTGKELVARALCDASHRATKPFVDVNCAALTETLIESEL